jgi:hypothetical protein
MRRASRVALAALVAGVLGISTSAAAQEGKDSAARRLEREIW